MIVLLVERDDRARFALCDFLAGKGNIILSSEEYEPVIHNLDGTEILILNPDGFDERFGVSLIEKLRAHPYNIPVIILSRKKMWADKAPFFTAGADDYLTVPCVNEELLARMEGLTRRYASR